MRSSVPSRTLGPNLAGVEAVEEIRAMVQRQERELEEMRERIKRDGEVTIMNGGSIMTRPGAKTSLESSSELHSDKKMGRLRVLLRVRNL